MNTDDRIDLIIWRTMSACAIMITIGCIAGLWASGCAEPLASAHKHTINAAKVLEAVGNAAIAAEKIDKAMSVKPQEIAEPEPIAPPVLEDKTESECPYCDESCEN